jgi:hypothetical protein
MWKPMLILIIFFLIAPCVSGFEIYEDPFAGDDSPDIAALNHSEVMIWMGEYNYYGNVTVITPLFLGLNCTKAGSAIAPDSEYEKYPEGKKVLFGLKKIDSITVLS